MLDNELLEIIKLKGFENVWTTLQYLNDIGCSDKEILDVLPKLYIESDYFKDVAYGKVIGIVIEEEPNNVIINSDLYSDTSTVQWVLFIGIIDDSNRKLRRMFDTYKVLASKGEISNEETNIIENFCKEKYEFTSLSDETIDYFRNIAIKHYGYALL